MRMKCRCTLEIGLIASLIIGSIGVQPVAFAKGGRGLGHSYGKSAPRPSESNAKPALRGESAPQGTGKPDTTHTAVTRTEKPADIDTRISVQPRLLGKSINPNKPAAQTPYHRRTLSTLPRVQIPPVRNAIGLPISPRGNLEPSTGLRSNRLPGSPFAVSPAVPNNTTSHSPRIGGATERLPHSSPRVVSPVAGRGAINGTGLANRHLGPAQIGIPRAVAGINGTAIKPPR